MATTSNKQLNFLQHIYTILKVNGTGPVLLPDNVLFEGGACETICRKLLKDCDVHTLLRLLSGIFYAQGVKANMLFFNKKTGGETARTSKLWVYGLRTNQHFTLKTNPLSRPHLNDFVQCYGQPGKIGKQVETERFKAFTYDEPLARNKMNLDIFWLKDETLEDSASLPAPDILVQEILDNLEAALSQFAGITEELEVVE